MSMSKDVDDLAHKIIDEHITTLQDWRGEQAQMVVIGRFRRRVWPVAHAQGRQAEPACDAGAGLW